MAPVAVEGTLLIGPGSGVIGNPPLLPVPGRPNINGLPVALVTDTVLFTYDDEVRGTQLLIITEALASLTCRSSGLAWALEGTLMSDPEVTVGPTLQQLVRA